MGISFLHGRESYFGITYYHSSKRNFSPFRKIIKLQIVDSCLLNETSNADVTLVHLICPSSYALNDIGCENIRQ
jgi:hypothetical protein